MRITVVSKLLAKLFPQDQDQVFGLLVLIIALFSIVVAGIFAITIELEHIHIPHLVGRILFIAFVIFLSILIVSTLVVVKVKHSIEQFQATESIMENIFELAVSLGTLKILVPVVIGIVFFFGWDNWKNLKQDTINEVKKQIDPGNMMITMQTLIDSSRTIHRSLQYHSIPIGTIVAYNGRQKLPEGWAPCDGREIRISEDSTFATPDLVDRFIIGTTDSISRNRTSKRIGITGGDTLHGHTFQSRANVITEPNRPSGVPGDRIIVEDLNRRTDQYPVLHSHKLSLTIDGTAQHVNNMPPYYALIFIIKYK